VLQEATKTIVLELVAKHDGVWGWCQFERAHPPGSLPDPVRVLDVLDELESSGLVAQVQSYPQPNYCVTKKGKALLSAG